MKEIDMDLDDDGNYPEEIEKKYANSRRY